MPDPFYVIRPLAEWTELLAEADRHLAEAAEHMRHAAAAHIAWRAAADQAAAATDDALTSYDDYLRRYLPDEWARQQALADPEAEGARRGRRAIADALDILLRDEVSDHG